MKQCKACNLALDASSFRERIKRQKEKEYKYLNSICRDCEKIERKVNRTPDYRKEYKLRKQALDPVKFHIQERISTWRKKANNPELSVEFLVGLWGMQQGMCYYTKQPMVLTGTTSTRWDNASLDRLNPKLGYIEGNLVWCTYRANSMKGQLNLPDFIELCRVIGESKYLKPVI